MIHRSTFYIPNNEYLPIIIFIFYYDSLFIHTIIYPFKINTDKYYSLRQAILLSET